MAATSAALAEGPSVSTKLALDRTRLAHERTLMAWVRTSTSLISFGFTIYKFFQYLRESGQGGREGRLLGPREYALMMIGIGVVALLLATTQHWHTMRTLRAEHPEITYSLATVLAGLVAVLGLAALIAVIFRQ